MRDAVIVDVVRSPSGRGKAGGALAGIHPAALLALMLRELVNRNEVDPALVDDVICGCVTPVGDQATNIARTALLAADFPFSVPGTTVDRQCGSSQQAAHFAAQGVLAGAYDVVIACGVESMSRVPMDSAEAFGNAFEPIRVRFPRLPPQGVGAELVAQRWKIDRMAVDEYAVLSNSRAIAHSQMPSYSRDLIPVTTPDGRTIDRDETIRGNTTMAALSELRPAFYSDKYASLYPDIDWVITAGNSSPLADGASAALIMSMQRARQLGLTPRARFVGFAVAGADPEIMLTAPIEATRKLLSSTHVDLEDVGIYEVNEAFASVPLAWSCELGADPDRLNPYGGAIALGHPLGASGTRVLSTMLTYLEDSGERYGLQTMCEAGGLANAMLVEAL